jgi:hypothetical protein
MLKEFIPKEHPCKKLKSNEGGTCPTLPDFADIYSLILMNYVLLFNMIRSLNDVNVEFTVK